jgi:16S rRNA (cytidine1402-2'-O)-methyltransferase
MQIVPIPGPSAPLAALVGSGLPSDRFAFEGFLPDKTGDRDKRLAKLAPDDRTLIFFAAPNNIASVLRAMQEHFGDRQACLARELTKKFEEFIRGKLSQLIKHVETEPIRGEYVIVVAGASEDDETTKVTEEEIRNRLGELLSKGARLKDAASLLAKETGWASSDVYKIGLSLKDTQ